MKMYKGEKLETQTELTSKVNNLNFRLLKPFMRQYHFYEQLVVHVYQINFY